MKELQNARQDCKSTNNECIDFCDPRKLPVTDIRNRGELPHLYKTEASYFVTFRLWDAIVPAENRRRISRLKKLIGKSRNRNDPSFAIQLAKNSAPVLRSGSCLLGDPNAAQIVADALLHFDQQRYQLAAWCVMPNHVHVAYTALGDHMPFDIHHSWKSFTANKINQLLSRNDSLWERESFDHLIRSVEHYIAFIEYIENNPVVAGLCETPQEWPFSSAYGRGVD